MTVHDLLLKRFATKNFDTTKKVSHEDLEYILECARLSPSSYNIQSWHIVVITEPGLRAEIHLASYNQPQVVEASHLLVICAVKDPVARINATAELIAAATTQEAGNAYRKMVLDDVMNREENKRREWLEKQTYLALESMILAAAERGIDSCPMEGFNREKVAAALKRDDIMPVSLLTLGYAAAPSHGKTRITKEDMTTIIA